MFTKENTKQIKGIAILLMLAHHLFAFPDRIPYDMSLQTSFYLSGMELTEIIGNFGTICVSLFMFLGGYGLISMCLRFSYVLFLIISNLFLKFFSVGFQSFEIC